MEEPSDPPRKFYQLKPKEFERVNEPVSAPPPDSTPLNVRGHLRAANAGPIERPEPRAEATNDLHAILRDNLARANAAGLNEVAPRPKRPSRRKRDYWIGMICGTVVLGGIAIKAGPGQPIPFTYAIAGLVIFNLGLWWTLWHVMDDY